MSKVQKIETDLLQLSPEELARFRQWSAEFDTTAWDKTLEQDVRTDRLDRLADKALRSHAAGSATRL